MHFGQLGHKVEISNGIVGEIEHFQTLIIGVDDVQVFPGQIVVGEVEGFEGGNVRQIF